MNSVLRTCTFALGAFTIAACSSDSRPVEDVLAEDSTLTLDVMSANRDSLTIPTDTAAPPVEVAVAPAPIESTSEALESEPVRPATVQQRQSTPRHTIRRQRTSAPKSSRRIVSMTAGKPALRRVVETTPMKSSALLPAGTELSLVTDQRVCASMSRVGDTFAARFADDVVGPIGIVIPKGTPATAQVSSVRKNLDLEVQSIAFAGHTYSIASDVTYTEMEKVRRKSPANKSRIAAGAGIGAVAGGVIGGNPATTVLGAAAGGLAGAVTTKRAVREDACIPDGGHITVKLIEPLKLALAE